MEDRHFARMMEIENADLLSRAGELSAFFCEAKDRPQPTVIKRARTKAPAEFHEARITRVIRETADCRSFEFEVRGGLARVFRPKPGQFVPIRFKIGGVMHERCYAISSLVQHGDVPRFTVKRVAGGLVSNYCNDELQTGMTVQVGGCAGRFRLRSGKGPIVLMAAGVAIAPMFPMLKEALSSGKRQIKMIIFDRDERSAVFLDALRELAGDHADRLQLAEVYAGACGVVSPEAIRNQLAGLAKAQVYMCGPVGFMECAETAALAAGIARQRIFINAR